jgi:hypothetical protein
VNLKKTIHALVDEGMSQSEALRLEREKKEKTMTKTATITRKVNQKEIKKVRIGSGKTARVYPVTEFVHTQDGVTVTYTLRNGKSKEEFVERGTFATRLITGYPTKISSDEE